MGLQHCAAMADAAQRLACYDSLSGRSSPSRSDSELSRYWELDAEDRKAELRFVAYRPNYILPLHNAFDSGAHLWAGFTQQALWQVFNGQDSSRSWNRAYLTGGIEQIPWSLIAKLSQRLTEPIATDNNPDLTHYRGRSELRLRWVSGPSVMALQYNGSPRRLNRGALTAEWSRSIHLDQPEGLRGYVQAFTGHGETLTDYNFRQTSVGVGVMFSPF